MDNNPDRDLKEPGGSRGRGAFYRARPPPPSAVPSLPVAAGVTARRDLAAFTAAPAGRTALAHEGVVRRNEHRRRRHKGKKKNHHRKKHGKGEKKEVQKSNKEGGGFKELFPMYG